MERCARRVIGDERDLRDVAVCRGQLGLVVTARGDGGQSTGPVWSRPPGRVAAPNPRPGVEAPASYGCGGGRVHRLTGRVKPTLAYASRRTMSEGSVRKPHARFDAAAGREAQPMAAARGYPAARRACTRARGSSRAYAMARSKLSALPSRAAASQSSVPHRVRAGLKNVSSSLASSGSSGLS